MWAFCAEQRAILHLKHHKTESNVFSKKLVPCASLWSGAALESEFARRWISFACSMAVCWAPLRFNRRGVHGLSIVLALVRVLHYSGTRCDALWEASSELKCGSTLLSEIELQP